MDGIDFTSLETKQQSLLIYQELRTLSGLVTMHLADKAAHGLGEAAAAQKAVEKIEAKVEASGRVTREINENKWALGALLIAAGHLAHDIINGIFGKGAHP